MLSFVDETEDVTAIMAAPLRVVSDVDVTAYEPRVKGMIDHLLMVTDR